MSAQGVLESGSTEIGCTLRIKHAVLGLDTSAAARKKAGEEFEGKLCCTVRLLFPT